MRLIDAIQLPEVLDGSKWVRLMPHLRTLCQTFKISNGVMVWCDNGNCAEFNLRRLHEICEVLDPKECL